MMVLAIAVNLLPVFLTTIAVDLGRGAPLRPNNWAASEPSLSPDWSAVSWSPVPLADRWGARIFAVSGNALIAVSLLAFLGFSLAMTVGQLGMMFLPKTVGAIPLMLFCCVASALLFPIASFAPIAGLAIAACILVGFTGSCLWPTTLAVAADRYPRGGATMFALLGALGNFGGIFMPWRLGWWLTIGVSDGVWPRDSLSADDDFDPLWMRQLPVTKRREDLAPS